MILFFLISLPLAKHAALAKLQNYGYGNMAQAEAIANAAVMGLVATTTYGGVVHIVLQLPSVLAESLQFNQPMRVEY